MEVTQVRWYPFNIQVMDDHDLVKVQKTMVTIGDPFFPSLQFSHGTAHRTSPGSQQAVGTQRLIRQEFGQGQHSNGVPVQFHLGRAKVSMPETWI